MCGVHSPPVDEDYIEGGFHSVMREIISRLHGDPECIPLVRRTILSRVLEKLGSMLENLPHDSKGKIMGGRNRQPHVALVEKILLEKAGQIRGASPPERRHSSIRGADCFYAPGKSAVTRLDETPFLENVTEFISCLQVC